VYLQHPIVENKTINPTCDIIDTSTQRTKELIMTKQFAIVTNYKTKIDTKYVEGWDGIDLGAGFQVELYLNDVLSVDYAKVAVGHGKLMAKKLGMRSGDASAIVVTESIKKKIAKHFKNEVNNTVFFLEI
jgi:hypothetical protein